jgi:hypothetical protein
VKLRAPFLIAAVVSVLISVAAPAKAAAPESKSQITSKMHSETILQ